MGAVARATPAGAIVDQRLSTEIQRQKDAYTLAHPPPPAPDLTDAAVRAARIEGIGAVGKGRRSTFLGGAGGFAAPATKRKTLLGGG